VDQYLQNNILQKVSKSSSYPNITIKHANMPKMTFAKVFANVYANIFIILMFFIFAHFGKIQIEFKSLLVFILITSYIDSKIHEISRELPYALIARWDYLEPFLEKLQTTVPSPLTLPKTEYAKELTNPISIEFKDIVYRKEEIERELLQIKDLEIKLKQGLYVVAGDSGEGKSLFMSIIGSEIFPTSGKIQILDKQGQYYDLNKMYYWKLRDLINYVWVSKIDFIGTSPVKLFRTRLLKDESSEFFNALTIKYCELDTAVHERNEDFILNNIQDPQNEEQINIDSCVKKILDDFLIRSGLFRENELHVLDTEIQNLSGGQQARLLTAYYLTGPTPVVLLDEGLERTTKGFEEGVQYTRERLIKFISYVVNNSDKTVFLLVQGGKEEESQIKESLQNKYLGTFMVKDGVVNLHS